MYAFGQVSGAVDIGSAGSPVTLISTSSRNSYYDGVEPFNTDVYGFNHDCFTDFPFASSQFYIDLWCGSTCNFENIVMTLETDAVDDQEESSSIIPVTVATLGNAFLI